MNKRIPTKFKDLLDISPQAQKKYLIARRRLQIIDLILSFINVVVIILSIIDVFKFLPPRITMLLQALFL
jgi:hypothetical protein